MEALRGLDALQVGIDLLERGNLSFHHDEGRVVWYVGIVLYASSGRRGLEKFGLSLFTILSLSYRILSGPTLSLSQAYKLVSREQVCASCMAMIPMQRTFILVGIEASSSCASVRLHCQLGDENLFILSPSFSTHVEPSRSRSTILGRPGPDMTHRSPNPQRPARTSRPDGAPGYSVCPP